MAYYCNKTFVVAFCFLLWAAMASSVSTDGCGAKKKCVYAPAGCSPDQPTCMFVSLAWNKDSETIDVELSGGAGGGNQYIAVAFGFVPRMEDADMYYCDGAQVKSGALQARQTPPVIDATLPSEITNHTASTNSGVGQCSFTRAKSVSKTVSNNQVKEFDLEDDEFYVLLARGNIAGGSLTYHTARAVSDDKIELEDDDDDDHEDDHDDDDDDNGDHHEENGGTLTNKENCKEGDDGCVFFKWSYDSATNSYNMELSGKAVKRGIVSSYVSIAFAFGPKMEEADLYVCSGTELKTGSIRTHRRPPVLDSDFPTGVVVHSTTLVDQIAKCSFSRPAILRKVVRQFAGSETWKTFDFMASKFYVLYCSGIYFSGNVYYHGQNRWVSTKAEDFRQDVTPPVSNEVNCGVTKNCFYNIDNCELGDDKCTLLSWKYNMEDDTFDFDISGPVDSDTNYVAFAFASSRLMEDADTYVCMYGANGRDLRTGAIKWRQITPILSGKLPDGITNYKSYYSDGIVSCSFTRTANIRRSISMGTKDFNLTAEPYFVLTALGKQILLQYVLAHANDARWASGSSIDFTVQPPPPVGCGNEDRCTSNVMGCHPTDAGCIRLSWTFDSEMQSINFTFSAGMLTSGNQYVAIAFGTSDLMENADLYYCTGAEFKSGVIGAHHAHPVTDATLPAGITNTDAINENGTTTCSFTRKVSITKSINGAPVTFDMSNPFYVLYAIGPFAGGDIQSHASDMSWSSPSAIYFTSLTEACGITRTCATSNGDCNPSDDGCIFMSWRYNEESQTVDFTVAGGSSNQDEYLAIAFAPSPLMQNADLYYCTSSMLKSGVIGDRHSTPVTDAMLPAGITNVNVASQDGAIVCSFTRAVSIDKMINGVSTTFDFSSSSFHLLFATGPFTGGNMQQHTAESRGASLTAFDFLALPSPPLDDGCDTTRNCISHNDCNPYDDGCGFVSWAYDALSQTLDVQFSAGGLSDDDYVALAFAPGPTMENADLYYCARGMFKSGVIGDLHSMPVTDAMLPAGVTNGNVGTQDGAVVCSFTRTASVDKMINGVLTTFDLSASPFHILFAVGSYAGDMLNQHTVSERWASGPITFIPPPPPITPPLDDGCGTTKNCISHNDCNPHDDGCGFVSWAYDAVSQTLDVQFSAGGLSDDDYLALAFAPGPTMENADLYYCARGMFKSGVIGDLHSMPVTDAMLPAGVTNGNVGTQDGAVVCSFTRTASVDKMINGVSTTFDLSASSFHILFAVGSYAGDMLNQHTMSGRWASDPITFIPPPPSPPIMPPLNDGCGTTKHCFSHNDCDPTADGCQFVSWSYDATAQTVDVVFSVGALSSTDYIAVAFAALPLMQNADLYYCAGGTVKSGVIGNLHTMPVTDAMLPSGVTNTNVRMQDGVTVCSFTRTISIDKDINGVATTFDLSTSPFHILFAVGSYAGDMLNQHTVSGRWASDPITFIPPPPLNDGCGTTKHCFSHNDCDPTADGCQFVSWSYDATALTVDVVFSVGALTSTDYIAVAFAALPLMQNADLYYCAGGTVKSGVIGNLHTMPVTDAMLPSGVTNTNVRMQDGVTVCSFTRTISIDKDINGVSTTFDLSASAFYILYAVGSYAGNVLNRHSVNGRGASSQFDPIAIPTQAPVTLPPITGCGTTKFCHTNQKGCTPASDNKCLSIAIEYDQTSSSYNIEFEGAGMGNGNTYVGIAFAPLGIMSNAELYFCTGTSLKSGTILGHLPPDQDTVLPAGVTNAVAESANGVHRCSFTRTVGVMRDISTGTTEFNFLTNEYYTLFCLGAMSGNNLVYHGDDKWSSGFAFNFTTI